MRILIAEKDEEEFEEDWLLDRAASKATAPIDNILMLSVLLHGL